MVATDRDHVHPLDDAVEALAETGRVTAEADAHLETAEERVGDLLSPLAVGVRLVAAVRDSPVVVGGRNEGRRCDADLGSQLRAETGAVGTDISTATVRTATRGSRLPRWFPAECTDVISPLEK